MQWLGGFALFILLGLILRDEKDIRSIVYAILTAGLITAIIGQIQSHSTIIDDLIVQAVAPSSTFANKNMAAHILSLSVAIGICLFFRSVSISKNILYAVIVAIMTSFIVFTKTRAAWLAFSVMSIALIIFLIWVYKKKKGVVHLDLFSKNKLIGYGVFAITFIALLGIGDTPIDMSRANKLINFSSDSNDRIPMFVNTFSMFYPIFGVGLGNWTVHYPYYMSSEFNDFVFSLAAEHYHTHNDILQILTETGIVGLLMISATVYLAFRALIRSINKEKTRQIWITLAILLSMIEILINSTFSFPFQLSAPIMLFFSYFALATLIDQKNNNHNFYEFKLKIFNSLTLIPLILLITGSTIVLADWKKAEQYYYRSMISWKINKPDLMIDNGIAGFNLNKGRLKLLDFISGGYILKNEPEKAIPLLNKVLEKYPYRLNTLHYKAQSLYMLGKKDEAKETMQFLLSLKPAYAPGYEMIAMFDADVGDVDSALKNLKKAIDLDPRNDEYLHKYALLLLRQDRNLEAKEYFEKALSISPENAIFNKNLGVLYINFLKEPLLGIPYIKKALKLDPNISNAESMKATLDQYHQFLADKIKIKN